MVSEQCYLSILIFVSLVMIFKGQISQDFIYSVHCFRINGPALMMSTVTVLTWYLVYCLQVHNTKQPLGESLVANVARLLLKEEKEERKVTEERVSVREGWVTIDEGTAARLDKNPQVRSFAAYV